MNKNLSIFQRIGTGILTIAVVFTAMYAPIVQDSTPRAHAFIGGGIVFDPANFGVNATQTVILNALNGLAWTVAKMTVQSLTRSVVNWINSGFEGSPAFATDLNRNLSYLGDAIADDFFQNLNQVVENNTGFNIKSPFQDQLNQKLREEYYRTTDSWGLNYTLNQRSSDPESFLNGNFEKGGFDAYFSASQNPANNPFGAYRLASNQLWGQIDAAAQQRRAELDWGRGFLPWRGKCNSAATAPGQPVSLSQKEKCPFNSVRTPGSIIEDQLAHSLGSGVRQLELADSINEIVGALIGQLVNQVLGSGGLLGASQPSSGGGRSYIDQAGSGSQLNDQATSAATGIIEGLKNEQSAVTTYRDGWQKILGAAQAANSRCTNNSEIQNAITKSNEGIDKANKALPEISRQLLNIQAAVNSLAANKSSLILEAVASYQSFLAASVLPSAAERGEAAQASIDTGVDEPGSPSMYTRMLQLQKSCNSS